MIEYDGAGLELESLVCGSGFDVLFRAPRKSSARLDGPNVSVHNS
jgi:hypothetical protein